MCYQRSTDSRERSLDEQSSRLRAQFANGRRVASHHSGSGPQAHPQDGHLAEHSVNVCRGGGGASAVEAGESAVPAGVAACSHSRP